ERDGGAGLSAVPIFDMTVTFGALKPAHRLHPAMHKCGRLALADIGIAAENAWHEIAAPELPPLDPAGDKYDRGLASIRSGEMPGAAALAASAAVRAGCGTVRLYADKWLPNVPAAVIQGREWTGEERARALLIGPGLGKSKGARAHVKDALTAGPPLIVDADALRMITPEQVACFDADKCPILTPHESEFEQLFPGLKGTK